MKCFFRLIIGIIILSNLAFSNCSCDSEVIEAYTEQISELEEYYIELEEKLAIFQNKINTYEKKMSKIFDKETVTIEILKKRAVAIKNQKHLLLSIDNMPVDLSEKNQNIVNEILLTN